VTIVEILLAVIIGELLTIACWLALIAGRMKR
jgi:hypothetical protein